VIFDPNIFAIATGIEEHAGYAVGYIEATRQIKATPATRTGERRGEQCLVLVPGQRSGREAIHAVFLYHAIHAGMDMGIVNAGALPIYTDIEPGCWNGSRMWS
jgi:5-methyltetrahydrofolate--homocysteine methyltransferase